MRSGGNRVKKSLEARSCFPNRKQQIHITISLSYFADTETPSRWEKLTLNGSVLPTSLQTPDQLDLKFADADSYLPHYQPIRRMPMS